MQAGPSVRASPMRHCGRCYPRSRTVQAGDTIVPRPKKKTCGAANEPDVVDRHAPCVVRPSVQVQDAGPHRNETGWSTTACLSHVDNRTGPCAGFGLTGGAMRKGEWKLLTTYPGDHPWQDSAPAGIEQYPPGGQCTARGTALKNCVGRVRAIRGAWLQQTPLRRVWGACLWRSSPNQNSYPMRHL